MPLAGTGTHTHTHTHTPLTGIPSPPMLFRKPPGLLEPGINVTHPHTPTCLLQGQRHTYTHTHPAHTHMPFAGTPSLLESGINVIHPHTPHTHPHDSCRDRDTLTYTHTPFAGTLSPPMLYGTPPRPIFQLSSLGFRRPHCPADPTQA